MSKAALLWVWAVACAHAQPRITNVRAVAQHDTVVITYELVGTRPGDQFAVRAVCWDGYEETPLKAISGRTVIGRGKHKLAWHVLDDMDLLVGDSITFTIMAAPLDSAQRYASVSTRDDRKSMLRAQLTGQVDTYLEQMYDASKLFRDFGELPFESRSTYLKLEEQTQRSNKAYQTLLTNRRDFEATVGALWGSSAGTETENFFIDMLDITHRDALTAYNDILKLMNDVMHRNYQGRSRKELVRDIQQKIYYLTRKADTEIPRLKNQAEKLYGQLAL